MNSLAPIVNVGYKRFMSRRYNEQITINGTTIPVVCKSFKFSGPEGGRCTGWDFFVMAGGSERRINRTYGMGRRSALPNIANNIRTFGRGDIDAGIQFLADGMVARRSF